MKTENSLYLNKTAEELINHLDKEGIEILKIIESNLDTSESYGAFFYGSIVEGNGNKSSDLDIMVLLDSEDSLNLNKKNQTNLIIENTKEFLKYQKGIELNISYRDRSYMDKIVKNLLLVAPAMYNPADVKYFPVISKSELQFLHNLKNGWLIHGKEIVELWKDECMVEILSPYVAINHFITSIELFEDLLSIEGNTFTQTYVGRMCVEHLFWSILGNENLTNQNRKWTFNNLNRLSIDDEKKQIIQSLKTLFFEKLIFNDVSYTAYVEELRTLIILTKNWLEEKDINEKSIKFVKEKINYTIEGELF